MKKLFIALMVVVCLFSLSAITFANSGKAYIPNFYSHTTLSTWINVSNITENPISIKITVYKSDGTIYYDTDNNPGTGLVRGERVTDYSDNQNNATVTFTLGPHKSGRVALTGSSVNEWGYGIIEWTQDSQTVSGLMVNALGFNTAASSYWYMPVNEGLPF